MAQEALSNQHLRLLLQAVPGLVSLHRSKMWFDYDAEADVLYFHFEEAPVSNHSEMRDDGVVLDYRDEELVGLTILEASSR